MLLWSKLKKCCKYVKDKNYRIIVNSYLGLYDRIPDEQYLKRLFKANLGYELDLKNPETFNEKLQWLKIHDRNPLYTTIVDKYAVKNYVEKIIGKQYIIPNLGVWNSFEEINFSELPDQFVLKCTHDSGGVVLCKNKEEFDISRARKIINKSLKKNYYLSGREWPYKHVKPRIIAEKYMSNHNGEELQDYKFFCFNGVVKCLYVSEQSHSDEQKLQFFDRDYNPIDCKRKDYNEYTTLPKKPVNYAEMIDIAEKLSREIPHVRVDLYEINHQVYFGEMTFFTGSGFIPFENKKWDNQLGKYLKISVQGRNINY